MKNMKAKEIRSLLDKYFAGNTTLEEEAVLRRYFIETTSIDEEFLNDKAYFEVLSDAENALPDIKGIENRLSTFMDEHAAIKRRVFSHRTFRIILAAASVLLIGGLSLVIGLYSIKKQPADTYSDPQMAYYEAQKTLLFISQKMQTGMQPLSNISKMSTGNTQLHELEKIDVGMTFLGTGNVNGIKKLR